MKTIVIIPARGGSKRLPEKNILDFGGIPLLAHSIIYAKANSSIVDAIYVSTDDASIKRTALHYGAQVIDRPEELSGDHEPTVSALRHCLEVLDDATIETVILLQPTNPLRPSLLLKDCFEVFQKGNCESLFSVTESHRKLGRVTSNRFIPFNYDLGQRSQDLDPLFFENGLLYITNAKSILESKIITEDAFPYLVNHIFTDIDIDTKDDFDYAEYLLIKYQILNPKS
jgi:N-acylneuraminate cytidylyltransferase